MGIHGIEPSLTEFKANDLLTMLPLCFLPFFKDNFWKGQGQRQSPALEYPSLWSTSPL